MPLPSILSPSRMASRRQFKPTNIASCQLWYKAEDFSNGATWRNRGIAGAQDATKVSSPTRQTVTNGTRTFPVVRFNGTSDYFTIPDFTYNLTGLTVFAVAKQDAATSEALFSHYDYASTPAQRSWSIHQLANGDVRCQVSADGGNTNFKQYDSGDRRPTEWGIVTLLFGSSTLSKYRNGLKQNPSLTKNGAVASLHNATVSLLIGAQMANGATENYWDGDIAELIMYDRALSDAERKQVEEYLSDEYDISRQGGRLFKPQLLPGLVADYDPEQGGDDFNTTLDVIETWPSWHDEGATSLDATGIGAPNSPTFLTNQQNGRPAADFDASDGMTIAAIGSLHLGNTVFLVLNNDSIVNFRWILDINGPSSLGANYSQPALLTSSAGVVEQPLLGEHMDSGGTTRNSTTVTTIETTALVTFYHGDGEQNFIRVNGTQEDVSALAFSQTSQTGTSTLGQRANAGNKWGGQLIRCLIYNRKLSDAEITQVEAHLLAKYGL